MEQQLTVWHDQELSSDDGDDYEQDIININDILNNKDLIIVSLLEYICLMHNKPKMCKIVCDYLQQNDIILDKNILSSNTDNIRYMCIELIKSMIGTDKQIQKYDQFEESRYKNDFIEIESLGEGGFGSVWKVVNKLDEKVYAIKKIKIRKLKDEGSCYYLNEAKYLSALDHHNIVRYYTTWIEFGCIHDIIDGTNDKAIIGQGDIVPVLYIQMELCSYSLDQYLTKRNYDGKEIDHSQEMKIFRGIIEGLKYIHSQGIIHGDINPKNIFFDRNNNIKIGDFGLSKKADKDDEDNVVDSGYYGNVLYMSPEQINYKLCGKKSDIYSTGIILFELLCPFSTMMERIECIKQIKDNIFDQEKIIEKNINLIKNILNCDASKRPSASKILKFIKH